MQITCYKLQFGRRLLGSRVNSKLLQLMSRLHQDMGGVLLLLCVCVCGGGGGGRYYYYYTCVFQQDYSHVTDLMAMQVILLLQY